MVIYLGIFYQRLLLTLIFFITGIVLDLSLVATNFGAHIFTTYLIAFGLDITKVESILDNSETKQGKRLYGTNIIVHSPEILKNEKAPVLILKAGIYNQEIKTQILSQINSNTIFWE